MLLVTEQPLLGGVWGRCLYLAAVTRIDPWEPQAWMVSDSDP